MKAQILKIAGVKSEKEFYKKFPTEAAFKKAHGKELKKAQLGASMAPEVGSYIGGDMDKNSPLAYRELYDDIDLSITGTNTAERIQLANLQAQQSQAEAAQKQANKQGLMDAISAGMGKNGKKVKRAQGGLGLNNPAGGSMTNPNPNVDMWGNPLPIGGGAPPSTPRNPYGTPMLYDQDQMGTFAEQATAAKGAVNPNANPSPVGAYVGAGLDIIQGISQLKGEKDALNLAKQSKMVSDVSLQASNTRPEQTKRRYVRPEDMAFGTEEMGSPYGIGTNYLSRNGSVIGGNPTEIQNTYAPYNTLYSDLGYEPLDDSDQIKQYRLGGPMAQDGWVTRAANAEFSCRANPRSNLKEAKEITSGGKGDPYREYKNERWKAQGNEWKNKGITKEDFNNAYNDSGRIGNTFMNPEYAKYFDPSTRQVKPEYSNIKNNFSPAFMYYEQAPEFQMGQRPNINQILNYQMSQPGGLEGYRKLAKDDFMPSKREGGLIEAQSGFDWSKFSQAGGSSMAGNLGQYAGSGKPGPNAGSSIGKGIGTAAGTAFLGPIGGMIGGFAGGAIGGLIDQKPRKTARFNEQTQGNMGNIAVGAGARGLQQGQYSAFMEDGGWMSNDWQPQVIAKFGDHTAEDYYNAGHEGMDSLRAGGHLTNYTPPSERAMQTYALGGELKTLWGGHAESISHNPYLPDGGETVMFRGQSHDEADSKGRTGIGVKYGEGESDGYENYAEYGTDEATEEANVEVERNEPMTVLPEGGQIDPETGEPQKAGVVYGNLVLNKQMAKDHKFGKEAGRKMKHIVKDWSKGEAKQNKIIEKSLNIIENNDDSTAFGQLAFATAKAMQQGANMKLKKYANDKIVLAGVQSAYNDTAKEYGLVADDLAKGKIKIDKSNNDMAKFGKSLKTAQSGSIQFKSQPAIIGNPSYPFIRDYVPQTEPQEYDWSPFGKYAVSTPKIPSLATPPIVSDKRDVVNKKGGAKKSAKNTSSKRLERTKYMPEVIPINYKRSENIGKIPVPETVPETVAETVAEKPKSKRDLGKTAMMAYNEILPYLRPNYKVPQPDFTGEMMAASMNQQEPVQAQLFRPRLGQPYDISFQDQLNANQADFNALQRITGYNPAAESALAAQKYAANSAILAGQFRANQGEKARVFEENRKLMDQADLTNLGILDKQYERQATAKSKTKAQAIEIAKSISDKLAQQRKEQTISNIEQSRYNYRFDANGRPINMNALAIWNTSGIGGSGRNREGIFGMNDDWMTLYDENGKFQGTRLKTKKQQEEDGSGKNGTKIKARNGSIVKAIKNL